MNNSDILDLDYISIDESKDEQIIEDIIGTEYSDEDQEEIMALLQKKTRFDMLWRAYKEYLDCYIILNNELKKIMFHVLLGSFYTMHGMNYSESVEKKSVRFHTFIIQDSGTGKSETFKSVTPLFNLLKITHRTTISDNESSMTGTVYSDKDNTPITKKGLLAELDVWICDEGSVLLKDLPYSKTLTDNLQYLMDEPGKVSKGMRFGTISYDSNTTVVAGSYMFEEFKETVMRKGFLQRMFVFYKKFSPHEEKTIRIGKNLLKTKDNTEKVEQLKKKILILLSKTVKKKHSIRFNREDTMRFNVYLETIYDEYIDKQFTGEKQAVLKTFFNRIHVIIDKVAVQRAFVNGHEEVMYDDMIYAADLAKLHLGSIQKIFENISTHKVISPIDRNKLTINGIIKKNNNRMFVDELVNELRELYILHKWDFGHKKTLSFIEELVSEGIIMKTKSESGREVLML